MTKHKTTSLYLHPAAIIFSLFFSDSKLFAIFVETYLMNVLKELLNP